MCYLNKHLIVGRDEYNESFSIFQHSEVLIASIKTLANAFLFLMIQVDLDIAHNALVDADSWEILEQVDVSFNLRVDWGGSRRSLWFAGEHWYYFYDNYN